MMAVSKKKSIPTRKKRSKPASSKVKPTDNPALYYCGLPRVKEVDLSKVNDPDRRNLILVNKRMWANGTVIHYYFFNKKTDGEEVTYKDGTSEWISWVGANKQRDVVRQAFTTWMDIGIGLKFEEVDNRESAEIRIGFMRGDGSWSYIGKEALLKKAAGKRTMNFGWDLVSQPETALHEIGHVLGFPHEHQNPNAGIVWDEKAVYKEMADTNGWRKRKTLNNIIEKIVPDKIQGSSWDPDSIMHYPFDGKLIKKPAKFKTTGIKPAPGLSDRDKTWVKTFYPPIKDSHLRKLVPFKSTELLLAESEQANFLIEPASSGDYQMRTFGSSDAVMVLFEDDNGDYRYMAGDDDSADDRNAQLTARLVEGRRYILRIRVVWSGSVGRTAVMLWQ